LNSVLTEALFKFLDFVFTFRSKFNKSFEIKWNASCKIKQLNLGKLEFKKLKNILNQYILLQKTTVGTWYAPLSYDCYELYFISRVYEASDNYFFFNYRARFGATILLGVFSCVQITNKCYFTTMIYLFIRIFSQMADARRCRSSPFSLIVSTWFTCRIRFSIKN